MKRVAQKTYAPGRPDYYREILAEKSALWADLYALTMGQALFTNNKHDTLTSFQAFIRKLPFNGGYLLAGGQNVITEWLKDHWEFNKRNLQQMRDKTVLNPETGKMVPLFTPEFIDYVAKAKMELTIDVMREGDLAFPDEPIYRVHGPVWQCLMVEAAILNALNSQSLFMTLASRIKASTQADKVAGFTQKDDRDPVLEFGMRRAQCIGGLEPSRAAYQGGIDATSNMLAEEYYGIPTAGTFAHALVMLYEDEMEAFADYAKAMPYNGIFLVDTYSTLDGVKKVVAACQKNGAILKGIRLDSGDMAYLSQEARKILDDAGYTKALIAASNDLDEVEIIKLKRQGARIDIWGVGTNLVTAKAQPALGGVYKLVAVFGAGLDMAQVQLCQDAIHNDQKSIRDLQNFVRDVIKLGEKPSPGNAEKATIQGEQMILRTLFKNADSTWRYDGDIIFPSNRVLPYKRVKNPDGPYDAILTVPVVSVPKDNPDRARTFPAGTKIVLPLKPLFERGALTGLIETVHDGRVRVQNVLGLLADEHKRLDNHHPYGVGIEKSLFDERRDLILRLRTPSIV